MPQPFSNKVKSDSHSLSYGTDTVLGKPELAAKVMAVISAWSFIDFIYASIVTECLKSDFEIVSAMLTAITGAEGKRAAIKAAIKKAHPKDVELFDAVDKVIRASRERRNEYAHHIWASSPEVEDSLCLIDPTVQFKTDAQLKAFWARGKMGEKTLLEDLPPFMDLSKVMVYSADDIERDFKEATLAAQLVQKLYLLIHPGAAAGKMREELLNQPQIQQALQQKVNRTTT